LYYAEYEVNVPDKEMTILEHVEELRTRILVCAIAIIVVALVAFIFSDKILGFILLPAGEMRLKAFSLLDGFFIKWRLALYAGIVVAFPIWAYQVYSYISPGLYDKERKAIFPLLAAATILFLIGSAFGFYLLWGMIKVLITFIPPQVDLLPTADDYISFVVFFMLACGLAFQLPTIIIILVQLRILNTKLMRKQRRIAYFALFAFAEIITPVSDPIVAPLTVMVPLLLLYELSIFVSSRIEAGRKNQEITSTV
jgi:sec-independent protein translocase protein TatC